MATPGSNILKTALRVIASQQIQYLAFVSRTNQANGILLPVYAPAITLRGSIQPVPRSIMERLGLDFQKHYQNIFVPNNIVDVRRDVTSDQFKFQGMTFQALSLTKWIGVDGWNECLVVEVPNS